MFHKLFYFIVALALCAFATPAHSADHVFYWRPFEVRNDLVPSKTRVRGLPALSFFFRLNEDEKFIDVTRYDDKFKVFDEKMEKNWSEFRYSGVHLFFSRYRENKTAIESYQPVERGKIGEAIMSFPLLFRERNYRDTIETMGRIFAPQLDLGIEF